MVLKEAQQTVLLVHGDVFLRHSVAEYLRSCGLRVVEAATTNEAVAVLARLKVDALIGDEAAPGTRTASELVAFVGNQQAKPRIVEITGSREKFASTAAKLCRGNQVVPCRFGEFTPAVSIKRSASED